MVDNTAKPLVTITGISGYIGSQTTLDFLKDGGFRVRGTVRDKNNSAKLQPLRDAFGELFDQIELVEADLLNDASMSAAIAGSTYVVHVASPFFHSDDESQLITPAVEGTLSVMRACRDNHVRRCVVTSSCASIIYRERPSDLFDETHWSDPNFTGISNYAKSKVLAEKAAWDFQASLPEAERFELVVINPGFVVGPSLRLEPSTSIDFCKYALEGKMPAIPHNIFPTVDVRDVAVAHLRAIKLTEAAGHRFVLSCDQAWWSDLVANLAERYGPEGWPVTTAKADPPAGYDGYIIKLNNAKSREILGIQYTPLAQSMIEMAARMIELGAANKPTM